MLRPILNATLRLPQTSTVRLNVGETVVVRVIKHIDGQWWAVGVRGKVFRAAADTPLVPGDELPAVVRQAGRHMVLQLTASQRGGGSVSALLTQLGLSTDLASREVVAALLSAGEPVERERVEALRARLRPGDSLKKVARLLVTIGAKGVSLDSPGLAGITEAIEPRNQGHGADTGQGWRQIEADQLARTIAEDLEQREGASGLTVLNHLPADEGIWVIVPLALADGGESPSAAPTLWASLRLLIDRATGQRRRLVLVVRLGGDRRLCFVIHPDPPTIGVFSSDGPLRERLLERWASLKTRVQKLGFQVDDNIGRDHEHDGFSGSASSTPYPPVDTYG